MSAPLAAPAGELPDGATARRIRERAGWPRIRVALELGVTEHTIVRWELHGVVPSGQNLLAYMQLLARLDQEAAGAA